MSNWVVGRSLISVPLGVYGGICAEDAESERALLDHIKQMATAEQVDYLELRRRDGGTYDGFHRNPRYVTFTAPLLPDPEANIKKLPRDTRYMIRKGRKSRTTGAFGHGSDGGFLPPVCRRACTGSEHPYSRGRYIRKLLVAEFSGHSDLSLIYSGDEAVSGGVLSFHFRETSSCPIIPRRPNQSSRHWQPIISCMQRLMKSASAPPDFARLTSGRSKKGTGAFAFKTQWNMTIEELDYQKCFWCGAIRCRTSRQANPTFLSGPPERGNVCPLWMTTLRRPARCAVVPMRILFLVHRVPYPPTKGEKDRRPSTSLQISFYAAKHSI